MFISLISLFLISISLIDTYPKKTSFFTNSDDLMAVNLKLGRNPSLLEKHNTRISGTENISELTETKNLDITEYYKTRTNSTDNYGNPSFTGVDQVKIHLSGAKKNVDFFPPEPPIPGGTYCKPSNIPSTCTYDETTIPLGGVTLSSGESICIATDFNYSGNISLTAGSTLYISQGANFAINGSISTAAGSEIILTECASYSIFGSYANNGGVVSAHCNLQTDVEFVNVLNNGNQPTCNQAGTYCPISNFFGVPIGILNLSINPCITTTGNITECEQDPLQTLFAVATPPAGSDIVWYHAPIGGNVVINPILNTPGNVIYYAESVDGTSGLSSISRTPVQLSIEAKASISAQPENVVTFAGSNAIMEIMANNVDTYQWQVSEDGGGVFYDISDGTQYSGTQTASLTINAANPNRDGLLLRVVISNSMNSCPTAISSSALLSEKVRTVITNRKITIRVNKSKE